jgi:hypothetical protein
VFVDGLDLDKLGFVGIEPLDRGRPSYHPGMMSSFISTATSIACRRADAWSESASVILR